MYQLIFFENLKLFQIFLLVAKHENSSAPSTVGPHPEPVGQGF
jgi:hypothetical protein